MKKIITLLSIALLSNLSVKGQIIQQDIDISNLVNDTEKIANEYFSPAFKGFIYSMNNGWYHTAKVHKKFGFDITIGASASIIPTKDEIFNIGALNLTNTANEQVSVDIENTPTIGGSNSDNIETATVTHTITENFNGTDYSYTTHFELPGGVKDDLPLNAVPAPSLQIALGLPYKFEIIGRIVPEVGTDDVRGNILGLGLKKEITSIFGPMEKTPLHVSLLAAFTKMKVDYTIDEINEVDIDVTDGALEFDLNSYTVQAIASLNFPIINFYGGVGFNAGKTTLKMLGDYTVAYEDSGVTATGTATNPFNLSTTVSGVNATLGARLSLGFFKIFGSYTMQEYNSINAGIALSFR